MVRVPVFKKDNRTKLPLGLPTFVRNQFSGNAKTQLLYALYAKNIVTLDEVKEALSP